MENPFQLFTAQGCARCRTVKAFMQERNIKFEELDIKAGGNQAFKSFYRENRTSVSRGAHDIEFPILHTGKRICQGIGPILGQVAAKGRLDGCIRTGTHEPGWVNGLNIHGRDLDRDEKAFESYLEILGFLKAEGLMAAVEADGRNPGFLKTLIQENLVKRLVFILRGPAGLYGAIAGHSLDEADLGASLGLLNECPAKQIEYRILLPVAAFSDGQGSALFLSPEQAAQAADFAQKSLGSKTHPFFIEPLPPEPGMGLDPLPGPALFKYRTACRRYMVKAEILK